MKLCHMYVFATEAYDALLRGDTVACPFEGTYGPCEQTAALNSAAAVLHLEGVCLLRSQTRALDPSSVTSEQT